jgi:MFS family permease
MTTPDLAATKRQTLVFAASQAILGSVAPIAISMGALAGLYLLGPDKSLATAPVTGFNVGVALGALPAAWAIKTLGQKHGFMVGSLISTLGGACAALALFQYSFVMFILALALMGLGGAFTQQIRFAAADNAPAVFKAQAISWVLGGGIVSAILGPQAVILTRDMFLPVQFAGAYAAIIVFGLSGFAILNFLRVTPQTKTQISDAAALGTGRPLMEIIKQRRFIVALICSVGSYSLMSFVMTGAPLAMVGCGFTANEATLGIQWHVLAMFGPSFFTGKLIARFGKETIVATGLVILMLCAVVALSGIHLWQFWTSLILLGLGWNFGFIGATSMVTDCYKPEEKGAVQGFHDFVLFSTVALSSLFSGKILYVWGWNMVNIIIFPVTILCLLALGWLVFTKGSRRPVSA